MRFFEWLEKSEALEKRILKRKLDQGKIDIIKNLKEKFPKMTQKQALIYLEKTHSIKISISTYGKVLKDQY